LIGQFLLNGILRDGYVIEVSTGKKVIDFKSHNLHVVGYSEPIEDELSFEELEKNLYYLKINQTLSLTSLLITLEDGGFV
jgi:aminopeptidase-like protein